MLHDYFVKKITTYTIFSCFDPYLAATNSNPVAPAAGSRDNAFLRQSDSFTSILIVFPSP